MAICVDRSLRRHSDRLSKWGLTHPSTHPRPHKAVFRTTSLGISQDTGNSSSGPEEYYGIVVDPMIEVVSFNFYVCWKSSASIMFARSEGK